MLAGDVLKIGQFDEFTGHVIRVGTGHKVGEVFGGAFVPTAALPLSGFATATSSTVSGFTAAVPLSSSGFTPAAPAPVSAFVPATTDILS